MYGGVEMGNKFVFVVLACVAMLWSADSRSEWNHEWKYKLSATVLTEDYDVIMADTDVFNCNTEF